jgi:hypothetical protein
MFRAGEDKRRALLVGHDDKSKGSVKGAGAGAAGSW